ncbi:MAG: iron hydrogenase small subunit [Candidatus Desulfofervidaceae bacterium]|nr:iron hydrogenase small subunit [Candidatus Desulfofervidaceae bacterium]
MKIGTFTRRQFLKVCSVTVGGMLLGLKWTNRAYAKVKSLVDYMKDRLCSIYKHDKEMKYRCSQDNPAIKKAYKEFFEHPMSEMAERLLHTHYVDRSGILKKLEEQGYFSQAAWGKMPVNYPWE